MRAVGRAAHCREERADEVSNFARVGVHNRRDRLPVPPCAPIAFLPVVTPESSVRVPSLVAAAALALTLVGCSGGAADPDAGASPSPTAAPSPTASATSSPSPEAAAVDPTVVPPVEDMTVEYVEAVVNTIEARSGELFAQVLAEPVNPIGALPDGVLEGLEALFAGDRLAIKVDEAEALAQSEEARALVLPAEQYEGVRYEIVQVSYAEPGCLIAVGRINRTRTAVDGGESPVLSLLSLTPAVGATNPTPWTIVDAMPNTNADGEPNSDEFALDATLSDLDGVFQHTCVSGEASRAA